VTTFVGEGRCGAVWGAATAGLTNIAKKQISSGMIIAGNGFIASNVMFFYLAVNVK
jgi:hypothetical protein